MPYENIIIVEGNNDRHAIWHLLDQKNDLKVCFHKELQKIEQEAIAIKVSGSYEELHEAAPVELRKSSELLRAGFIFDADTDPLNRWKSMRNQLLRRGGGQHVPEEPPQEGWIGVAEQPDRRVRVGFWMMPDNQQQGALEEFAMRLVPDHDSLWNYAVECVDGLEGRMSGERYERLPESKAQVHTWLAWQKTPGEPIGQAIKHNTLSPQANVAQAFVEWARRLFERE